MMIGAAHEGHQMGHSLAIRLPAAVVEALNLKEDDVEIRVAESRKLDVARNPGRKNC
jgi:antitoxin MazE